MTPDEMRANAVQFGGEPVITKDCWDCCAELAERLDKIILLLEDRNRLVARLTDIAEAEVAEREARPEGGDAAP